MTKPKTALKLVATKPSLRKQITLLRERLAHLNDAIVALEKYAESNPKLAAAKRSPSKKH